MTPSNLPRALVPDETESVPDASTALARPRTRGDCIDGPRPCPWVSCRHHLALEVRESGDLKLTFPDLEIDELGESCALDVADRGAVTLEEVGIHLNLTRERIRQIEGRVLAEVKDKMRRATR